MSEGVMNGRPRFILSTVKLTALPSFATFYVHTEHLTWCFESEVGC